MQQPSSKPPLHRTGFILLAVCTGFLAYIVVHLTFAPPPSGEHMGPPATVEVPAIPTEDEFATTRANYNDYTVGSLPKIRATADYEVTAVEATGPGELVTVQDGAHQTFQFSTNKLVFEKGKVVWWDVAIQPPRLYRESQVNVLRKLNMGIVPKSHLKSTTRQL